MIRLMKSGSSACKRKLYQWSRTHPEDSYRDLWNWTTDIRNLLWCAWREKSLLTKGDGPRESTG